MGAAGADFLDTPNLDGLAAQGMRFTQCCTNSPLCAPARMSLASGMLPICLGQATKISAFLLGAEKVYEVTAAWGVQTDTGDADGTVTERCGGAEVAADTLATALSAFRGEIEQVPPMYSALKRDGRRLYELAREGKEVPREPRPVTIRSLEVSAFDPRRPVLRVHCSKGTYVRTLVEDIARTAGTLGHVAALRRTAVLPFRADDMVSMEALEAAAQESPAALDGYLRPVDQAVADWPAVELSSAEVFYLRQGHPVTAGRVQQAGPVRLYGPSRGFLGVGEVLDDGRVAPRRLFA